MTNLSLPILTLGLVTLCGGFGFAQNASIPEAFAVEPLAPVGETNRYLVPFAKSDINIGVQSGTVVTVVNNSATNCSVSVEWVPRNSTVPNCTTTQLLDAGTSASFCSRSLFFDRAAVCARSCPVPGSFEGKARVSSTTGAACSKIALDAAVYYTSFQDTQLFAIRSLKVVKAGAANIGD